MHLTARRDSTRCLAIMMLMACGARERPAAMTVRDGDIVFQTSRSAQSQAIQLATHSPYSHMGLILHRDGRPFVLEAVARVKLTPLEEWAARGEGSRYVVRRLRDAGFLGDAAKVAALVFEGRPYDPYFEWSDRRVYCSELVWKAYDRGLGVHLGALRALSSFDLSSQVVKSKLAERYGTQIPSDEKVISPEDIFVSPQLEEVRE